jgi:predicted Zn-dependent peptidase
MRVVERKLENGIPVLIENIENLDSATIGIYVKTGSKNELPEEEGISHLLEHMMFKGTENRSAKEISETIDNIGGHMNAYTSKEITAYYVSLLHKHLDTGIDILTDMFLNSTFTEENLEKEKKVIIEEINMYEDVPEEQLHDLNSEFAITGNHSRSVLGTKKTVMAVTREMLLEYFNSRYTVDNLVISIAGRVEEDRIMDLLNEKFGSLNRKLKDRQYDPTFKVNGGEKKFKKETNQVHLCVNTRGVSFLDDERYELSIISNILGGNMSSRLFQKIREERGLAYSVYTYLSSYEEGGLFTVYAGTTKEAYATVIELIKEEFKTVKENGISQDELSKAKNQLLSMLILGLETSKARMSRMANSYLMFKRVKPIEEITEKIEKIKMDDIKRVSKEIFDERYYSVTVLGDIQ